MTDEAHPNQEYADRVGQSPEGSVPPHVSPAELQQQQSSGQGGSVSTGGSTGTIPGTLRTAGSEELNEDEMRQLARERGIDDAGSVDELRERLTGRIATGIAEEPAKPEATATDGPAPAPASEPAPTEPAGTEPAAPEGEAPATQV